MKAIVQDEYGPPEVLELREVEKPILEGDEVLVRVHAAGVNPEDWHRLRGVPYVIRLVLGLRKPSPAIRGTDLAGRVETVGADVRKFQPGDEVFGGANGTFAEYAVAREKNLATKPATLTFEEAAAIPVAGTTALQGLRDSGELQSGQSVLINGASGGVGTFAVQIAKSNGAEVTGVCSTRNVELVRSLGADHVIDYSKVDFTRNGRRYNLVFDLAGNRSLSELRRSLTPEGTLVLCSGEGGRWIGPLNTMVLAKALSPFQRRQFRTFLARLNSEDLEVLKDHIDGGALNPVLDRTYPLREVAEAIRYLETKRARGKVIVTI